MTESAKTTLQTKETKQELDFVVDGAPVAAPPPGLVTVLSERLIVEGALFSAGKPVSAEEIGESTGLPVKSVRDAIKALAKEYEARETSLEVQQAGTKFAMQLKAAYAEHSRKLAPMEIPAKLLKTLALIAFHQPLRQSDLKEMIGSRVYEHVHELKERGLVSSRAEGLTYVLTTTEAFPEYFGIPASDPHAIKVHLAAKAGVQVPPTREDGTTIIEQFDTPEAQQKAADVLGALVEGLKGTAEDAGDKTPESD